MGIKRSSRVAHALRPQPTKRNNQAANMPPKKADKKPAKKTVKKGVTGKKKKAKVETYKIYIYKVLKQVHHELLHQRHLREDRLRGLQARQVQQEANCDLPRDSDRCQAHPPRRARQARRLRGNQGRHQVHLRLS